MLLIAMTGTFFIRDSTSNPGSFALSVRVPTTVKESGIANILIERGPDGNFSMPVSFDSQNGNMCLLIACILPYC